LKFLDEGAKILTAEWRMLSDRGGEKGINVTMSVYIDRYSREKDGNWTENWIGIKGGHFLF
jgi:hypothetical protein